MSADELQQLFAALTARSPCLQLEEQNEGDEKRTKILEWMRQKRGERMRSFRRELLEKRNSEVHPFEPKKTQTKVSFIKLGINICLDSRDMESLADIFHHSVMPKVSLKT